MPENKNLPNLDFSGFSTEKYMNKKFKDVGNAPYETPAYGTGVDPSKYREYLGQGFDVYAPDIERKRAESQSWGEQIGAFANQSDRKSTRLNSSHLKLSRMPSSA